MAQPGYTQSTYPPSSVAYPQMNPYPPPPQGYQAPPPQVYQGYPPYQGQPPQGYPVAPSKDPNQLGPAPGRVGIYIEPGLTAKGDRVCQHCQRHFAEHRRRNGIPTLMLILIILLSCFVFLFLLLFICLCNEYKVCPHCGRFSGHGESNGSGVCLC